MRVIHPDRRSALPPPGSVMAVVVATRDEAASIGPVLSEIHEAAHAIASLIEVRVVLVDDASSDGTTRIARDWSARLGLPLDVVDGPGQGLGAAVIRGMQYAVSTFGPQLHVVANLDGDGQHDARELPTLFRAMLGRRLDIVIGSRWARGGRSHGTSMFRTVGSNVGNGVFRLATGVREVRDATTSFRVYSPEAVRHIVEHADLYPRGYAFFSAIVADADSAGLGIGEVPITFRPRYQGESKLTGGEVGRFFRSLPQQRRIRRRPLSQVADSYRARDELAHLSASSNWNDWILRALTAHDGDGVQGPILEVGAGTGAFSAELRRRFPGSVLVSIEPDAVNAAELSTRAAHDDRWVVFHGTLGDWIAAERSPARFDRIFYVSVLEHVPDPVRELSRARDLLSASGQLSVLVPAGAGLYGPIDRKSGHFRRFTDGSLRAVVEASGLEVRGAQYLDRVGVVPYWFMYRLLSRSSLSRGSARVFDQVYVPAAGQIDAWIPDSVPGKNVVLHASR
jgi:dolichol-phosphate mannosyltransferase